MRFRVSRNTSGFGHLEKQPFLKIALIKINDLWLVFCGKQGFFEVPFCQKPNFKPLILIRVVFEKWGFPRGFYFIYEYMQKEFFMNKDIKLDAQQNNIRKVAKLIAKEGHSLQLREALQVLELETVQERGCIEFSFYEALNKNGVFILLEQFVDQKSFSEHMSMPHTKAFFQMGLVETVKVVDVPLLNDLSDF